MLKSLILSVLIVIGVSVKCTAETRFDVAYGTHPKQALDVYAPETPKNAPILVMLHGGGWAMGDKRNSSVVAAKRAHWVGQGWIFVSVNTRLVPDANPIEQAEDLARAMALIQTSAASWGGDPSQIALMGHSAGAHVALLLAADPALQARFGLRPWPATVALDTAALDVPAIMRRNPARLYRNAFGSDPEFWRAASPMTYANRDTAPALLVCSTKRLRPCPAATQFARKGDFTVLRVNLSHGDINRDLGIQGSYTSAVDAWLRQHGFP